MPYKYSNKKKSNKKSNKKNNKKSNKRSLKGGSGQDITFLPRDPHALPLNHEELIRRGEYNLFLERFHNGYIFDRLDGAQFKINIYQDHEFNNLYDLVKNRMNIKDGMEIKILRRCLNDEATKILMPRREQYYNEAYNSIWYSTQSHNPEHTLPTYLLEGEKLRTLIREDHDHLCLNEKIYEYPFNTSGSSDGLYATMGKVKNPNYDKHQQRNEEDIIIDVTEQFMMKYKFQIIDRGYMIGPYGEYQNIDSYTIFIYEPTESEQKELAQIRRGKKKYDSLIKKYTKQREKASHKYLKMQKKLFQKNSAEANKRRNLAYESGL